MGYGFFGGKIICPSAPVLGINNDKSLSMLVQSYGMIIPISTGGGGVFHLQPSKWLRTPKQSQPLP